MSHVATVACEIKDLDALRVALEKFGAELLYGQKEFQFYAGRKAPCLHSIQVPGTSYQVGLRQRAAHDQDTFEMACDFYDGRIASLFGQNLVGLQNEYLAVVAEDALRKGGYRVSRDEEAPANQIRLVAHR